MVVMEMDLVGRVRVVAVGTDVVACSALQAGAAMAVVMAILAQTAVVAQAAGVGYTTSEPVHPCKIRCPVARNA